MGWWNCLKRTVKRDPIQTFIGVVGFLTFIALIVNLYFFWKQNSLTQTLNQPFCAVKAVKVEPVRKKVFQISAIIKNFGKYAAKDTSIEWEIVVIKNIRDNPTVVKIKNVPPEKLAQITLLPEHELDIFLVQFPEEDFNKMVKGYESAVSVSLTVKYQNMSKKPQRYSCTYLITRLADIEQSMYEVSLTDSKLQPF